jgi:hypothetical protein
LVLEIKTSVQEIPMDAFLSQVPEAIQPAIHDAVKFTGELGWIGGDPRGRLPAELGSSVRQPALWNISKMTTG